MVVTIADRSVTQISSELNSPLQLEPCCQNCKATDKSLRTCSSCKMVKFCCRECQAADWERHKKEDGCTAIKKLRRQLEQREAAIKNHWDELMTEAIGTFGVADAFLGRVVEDLVQEGMPDPVEKEIIMSLLAGRFYHYTLTEEYIEVYLSLYEEVLSLAERYHTRALWETILGMVVEMNRLGHASDHELSKDILVRTSGILLKLHRDDDAIACLLYWLEREALGPEPPVDTNLVKARKGEWPFPVRNDARFADMSFALRNSGVPLDALLPSSLTMIPLVVKLRHVCMYDTLSTRGDAFLTCAAGESLGTDVGKYVVSFVTGGKPAENLYKEQKAQLAPLISYICSVSPQSVVRIVDSSLPPPANDDEHNKHFDMKLFLENHDKSSSVVQTLSDIIMEEYPMV